MSLIQVVADRQRKEISARRAAAGASYRALLLRNDHPREGDEAGLAAAMSALGRTLADLSGDLALLLEATRCEELIGKSDTILLEEVVANREHGAAISWAAEERESLEVRIAEKLLACQARLGAARNCERELSAGRRALPTLREKLAAIGVEDFG
jgi:hypothetical protein